KDLVIAVEAEQTDDSLRQWLPAFSREYQGCRCARGFSHSELRQLCTDILLPEPVIDSLPKTGSDDRFARARDQPRIRNNGRDHRSLPQQSIQMRDKVLALLHSHFTRKARFPIRGNERL